MSKWVGIGEIIFFIAIEIILKLKLNNEKSGNSFRVML